MDIPIKPIVSTLKPITKPLGRLLLQVLTRVEKLDTDTVKHFQDKEDIDTEEFIVY